MVEGFAACPNHLHVQLPAKPTDVVMYQLEAEADARWSFVTKKANKPWLGLAMDAKSRQIMAFHVGDRSRASAKALWAKVPEAYQHHATLAQFLAVCSRLKWSRHWTKSPCLALLAMAGSSAAYKIISACSNAVS